MKGLEEQTEKEFYGRLKKGGRKFGSWMLGRMIIPGLIGVLGLGALPGVKGPFFGPSSAYAQEGKQEEGQGEEKKEKEETGLETVPLVPLVPLQPWEQKKEEGCQSVEECEAKGEELLKEGGYGKAAELFLGFYNQEGGKSWPVLLYYTAVSYEKGGELERAIEYYEKYIKEYPGASQRQEIEKKKPGLYLYSKGKQLYDEGRFSEAIQFFEEAKKLLSLEGMAYGVLCLEIADCYEKERGFEESYKYYQSCEKLAPGEKEKGKVEAKIKKLMESRKEEEETKMLPLVQILKGEEKQEEKPFWEKYSWEIIGGSGALSLGGVIYGMVCDSSANKKFEELVKQCGGEGCEESRIKRAEKEIEGKITARNVSYGLAVGTGAVSLGLLGWKVRKYLKNPETLEKKDNPGTRFWLEPDGFKMGFEF